MKGGIRVQRLVSIAVLLGLLGSAPAHAAEDETDRRRALFQEAYEAGLEGNTARFEARARQLRDYVLYPYLEYARLKGRIRQAKAAEVADFLSRHEGEPLEWRLREAWLRELARRGDWRTYLEFHHPTSDVTLRCHHGVARLRTGRTDGLEDEVLALWLSGRSVVEACDPLFEWLYRTNRIDQETRFRRVALAMEAGNLGLAAWLARDLEGKHRVWYRRWRDMTARPEATLKAAARWEATDTSRRIARHGLMLLARGDDGGRAWAAWEQLDGVLAFDAQERGAIIRHLALDAATDYRADAAQRLAMVPASHVDESVHAWRARVPLRQLDWPAVLEALAALPESMQAEPRWRYWRARALEATGRLQEAYAAYAALSKEPEYYGFLAADRMGRGYRLENEPILLDAARQKALISRPAMARALELHHVGLHLSARREWHHALTGTDVADLRQAALLAERHGWHDRTVWALAQTGDRSAYELRFPFAFEPEITRRAAERSLDPAWVFALVRAESGFITDAHSPAGARGLMQLMPDTGRRLSRKLGLVWRGTAELSNPGFNVVLGTGYLADMLARFGGDMVLATAAYNAGPHRVERWIAENPPVQSEIWAETLPFYETRDYVQRVLAYTVVYDWRLDGETQPLSARLPDGRPSLALGPLCWWPMLAHCR